MIILICQILTPQFYIFPYSFGPYLYGIWNMQARGVVQLRIWSFFGTQLACLGLKIGRILRIGKLLRLSTFLHITFQFARSLIKCDCGQFEFGAVGHVFPSKQLFVCLFWMESTQEPLRKCLHQNLNSFYINQGIAFMFLFFFFFKIVDPYIYSGP